TRGERAKIPAPRRRALAGQRAERVEPAREVLVLWIHHRIGAKGGDHAPVPPRRADGSMIRERVEGRLRRRQHFDTKAIEESARAELGAREALGDPIIDAIGRGGRQALFDTEDVVQRLREPKARRRPTEKVPMLGEAPPNRARIALVRTAV